MISADHFLKVVIHKISLSDQCLGLSWLLGVICVSTCGKFFMRFINSMKDSINQWINDQI